MKPSGSRPPATVLVCTRGRGNLVPQAVGAIVAALGASDELVVVEAETTAARELVADLGDARCRWLSVSRPGKSHQLNHGVRAARNDVIVITDDDCLIAPGWIDAMAEPFLEADVGIAFGHVEGLSQIQSSPPKPPPPGPAPPGMWRFSHGAAMAVRATAAFEVGGFDERLGPGASVHGEEADLMLRMGAAGWRCWVVSEPAVEHMEWRTDAEHQHNLLVYERGAGAWVGAALRRNPRAAAGAILTRLSYQAAHLSGSRDGFALRAQAAFCSGLWTGIRMRPERFLEADGDRNGRGAGRAPSGPDRAGHPAAALPWPALRGRRCLTVGSRDGAVARELELRGAAEVVALELPGDFERLGADELGTFDVVVADGLLGAEDPQRWLRALRGVCESHLVSIERVQPVLSIAARRRPYLRLRRRRHETRWVVNGAAHRELLGAAGFEVVLGSRPWLERLHMQRALLARALPSGAPVQRR